MKHALSVLFICTGNACRSIMAEALLAHLGRGRFTACSAGSHPTGHVDPRSLETLARHGLPTAGFASKSLDDVAQTRFDIVVTVCDAAAGESCPVFPGAPLKTHWGVADPARARGSADEIRAAFERTFGILERRIRALSALPAETLDRVALQAAIDRIGTS